MSIQLLAWFWSSLRRARRRPEAATAGQAEAGSPSIAPGGVGVGVSGRGGGAGGSGASGTQLGGVMHAWGGAEGTGGPRLVAGGYRQCDRMSSGSQPGKHPPWKA